MIDKTTANKDKLLFKKNVVGITSGTKITSGVDTGQRCIIVEVVSKQVESSLST